MWWVTYTALAVNLVVIWFMPKRLTTIEIYTSWFAIVAINLSTDIIFALYMKLYELGPGGIQLRVHLLEWTLGASYGIIYLNFIPQKIGKYVIYLIACLAYSILFEVVLIHVHFITYKGWKLYYSAIFYLIALLYFRWHLHFIRNGGKAK